MVKRKATNSDSELKNNLEKEDVLIESEPEPEPKPQSKPKRKPSQWILDVKDYQKKHNLSYKDSMIQLASERRIQKNKI